MSKEKRIAVTFFVSFILALYAMLWFTASGEEKRAQACEDKGGILITSKNGKDYCVKKDQIIQSQMP